VKAELVRVEADDGLELVGLYSAPPGKTARRAVLHTHGFAGNFYENRFIGDVCDAVVARGLAFLATNNRGHDYRSDNLKGAGADTTYHAGGAMVDVFEECVHDIGGGVRFLSERGHDEVYFEGHSLGCCKTVYYLSEVGDEQCAGLVLVSPPEMFGLQEARSERGIDELLSEARSRIAEGRGDVPMHVGRDVPFTPTAFVSLFGDPSRSDIFPFRLGNDGDYGRLASIERPMLVTYGDVEEAVTGAVEDAARLIEENASAAASVETLIVRGGNHVYWGHEGELARAIAGFVEP